MPSVLMLLPNLFQCDIPCGCLKVVRLFFLVGNVVAAYAVAVIVVFFVIFPLLQFSSVCFA